MALSRFRLITFDVTDTLLKLRSSPGKQYGELGAMFGVSSDSNKLVANFKRNWHRMSTEHPNFGLHTNLGWRAWSQQLIISTFIDTGVQTSRERLVQMSDHLQEIFKTSACWQQCFGAFDLLYYIKQQQNIRKELNDGKPIMKIGIISNFDQRLDTLLKNMKLDEFIDFSLNSYDVGYEKPDQRIFDKAIEEAKIENLKPHECLHIGDTALGDYIGARQAGWCSALIHDIHSEDVYEKYGKKIREEHVFSSLFDFHKRILSDSVRW